MVGPRNHVLAVDNPQNCPLPQGEGEILGVVRPNENHKELLFIATSPHPILTMHTSCDVFPRKEVPF